MRKGRTIQKFNFRSALFKVWDGNAVTVFVCRATVDSHFRVYSIRRPKWHLLGTFTSEGSTITTTVMGFLIIKGFLSFYHTAFFLFVDTSFSQKCWGWRAQLVWRRLYNWLRFDSLHCSPINEKIQPKSNKLSGTPPALLKHHRLLTPLL